MRDARITSKPNNKDNYRQIGSYLVEANFITQEHLSQALKQQKSSQERIGDILVRQGHIDQQTLNYFIEKIIEPEQSKSLRRDLQSDKSKNTASNTSFENSIRQNKILNLPVLRLSPKKIFRILLIIVACLVLAGSLVHLNAPLIEQSASASYAARLFKLDEENNFPTLYSGLTLGLCSILLIIISNMKKRTKSVYTRHWQALSWIFLYLAIDEVSSIHEILNGIRPLLNTKGLIYFAWVIPGIIFITIFLLIFWQFIQSLPRKTKNLFIMSGAIYIGGAIGMEMLGGYSIEVYGQESFIYFLISTIEEFLEMFGIAVFIYALLSYITNHIDVANWQICFNRDKNFKKSLEN